MSGLYFLLTAILKWGVHPDWLILLYGLGAGVGLMIFEILEQYIFAGTNETAVSSPLRSGLVQMIIIVVSFFVLTSTGSKLGAGLVLFLQLRLLDLQNSELEKFGSLTHWSVSSSKQVSLWYLIAVLITFLIETVIFIIV